MESALEKFITIESHTQEYWDEVLQTLVELTRYCLDGENRVSLAATNYKCLGKILETVLASGICHDEILVEAFRFLRNSVVSCKKNQDAIREQSNMYNVAQHFLQSVCSARKLGTPNDNQIDTMELSCKVARQLECSENKLLAIRCSLQFLANSMVENYENTVEVVRLFLHDLDTILNTFPNDEKVISYVAMIIHLALKNSPSSFLVPSSMIQLFLLNIHLEFVVYTMESLVVLENFAELIQTLEPESRIRLMNFLNVRQDLAQLLCDKTISWVKMSFVERSDFILRSKLGDRDNTFCWEVAVLLEALCTISITDKATCNKSDTILLTTVLCLLRQIHEAGNQNPGGDNVFSPVADLGKLASVSTPNNDMDDIRVHPTFQFKANLIRLIANLAHRNTAVQERVRELECLPIILDSCKVDARNPFIPQWSVLAIRNLCEGNEENQTYIRRVQQVDTENLLPKVQLVDLCNTHRSTET